MSTQRLTHANGAPVADNLNIQTAGPRGPALLQDIWLLEKLAHFDREVIPERRMHAKGSGAYGTFTVTQDIDPAKISARLKNGVLNIELRKAEKAKPTKIKVNA